MTFSAQTILAVGAGGFLGAVLRFYVNTQVAKNFPGDLPLATLGVNLLGSFLIGALIAIFIYYSVSDTTRAFLITGFLGALTTYSTFAIESYFLLNTSLLLALGNMALNLFGTIVAAGSGYKLFLYLLK
ncbi:MAG: CrcB family protein [Campylobacterota bacterium]|nr:CrcB family protein [Campylobacterota bacterium]